MYTYSGIVLIAVNPFSNVGCMLSSHSFCVALSRALTRLLQVPLYSPDYVQMYAGRRKGELDPHLFAIAEDAYRCMIREGRNQTIIVSGERFVLAA